jgi:hypothetical protein
MEDAIRRAFAEGKDLFIGRNGSTESEVMLGSPIQVYEPYLECAGIWNNYEAFVGAARAATKAADLVASGWFEPVAARERAFLGNQAQIQLEELDPIKTTYTKLLANQHVAVISPFAATMTKQYEKRNEIWPDERLPTFASLTTIKTGFAPRIAGSNAASRWPNHVRSWQDAVEHIVEQVPANCRVVLIGCGGIGMLVAHRLKQRGGHIVIVVGGVLQLLFGIKGRRWRAIPTNDAWTSPSRDETPAAKNMIEAGCYW